MVLNILTFVALAGTALAACPLSVEISSVVDHVAQVAVTNTGNKTITVFKGNTVLSEHATKDLVASAADGTPLPFEGIFVNYKRAGLASNMFQTFQPGETVTSSVNAAKTYKLDGIKTAQITAVQGFQYVFGSVAPTNLTNMQTCGSVTSSPVAITPNQKLVRSEHIGKRSTPVASRIQKRDISYSSCSTARESSLKATVIDTISMASAAYTAAASGADKFTTWFISTSEETKVRSIYKDVVGVRTTAPTISCTDTYGDCSDGSALLYTVPSDNTIIPCPDNGYWGFPEESSTCTDDDYDRAGSILHEMTHLYGTEDYAYGPTAAKELSASEAAENADTYEMYAGSVRLGGCTTG